MWRSFASHADTMMMIFWWQAMKYDWHVQDTFISFEWCVVDIWMTCLGHGKQVDEIWKTGGWHVDEIWMTRGCQVNDMWMKCLWHFNDMWSECWWHFNEIFMIFGWHFDWEGGFKIWKNPFLASSQTNPTGLKDGINCPLSSFFLLSSFFMSVCMYVSVHFLRILYRSQKESKLV